MIGRTARDLPADDRALEAVAGFTIMNDWSARDLQRLEMSVGLGPSKGKDFATSLGPEVVSMDELAGCYRDGRLHLEMTAIGERALVISGKLRFDVLDVAATACTRQPGRDLAPGRRDRLGDSRQRLHSRADAGSRRRLAQAGRRGRAFDRAAGNVAKPRRAASLKSIPCRSVAHASISATRLDSAQATHRAPHIRQASRTKESTTKKWSRRPGFRGPTASSITCGRRRESTRLEPAGTSPLGFRRSADAQASSCQDGRRCRGRATRSAAGCCSSATTMSRSHAAVPNVPQEELFRNADADEVVFVHRGRGLLHTMFGPLSFRDFDYVVIPRCTTYRFEFEAGCGPDLLVIESKGSLTIPAKYVNADGQLKMGAPYSERDLHGPSEIGVVDRERGDFGSRQGRPPADSLHAGEPSVRRRGMGWIPLSVHVQRR